MHKKQSKVYIQMYLCSANVELEEQVDYFW